MAASRRTLKVRKPVRLGVGETVSVGGNLLAWTQFIVAIERVAPTVLKDLAKIARETSQVDTTGRIARDLLRTWGGAQTISYAQPTRAAVHKAGSPFDNHTEVALARWAEKWGLPWMQQRESSGHSGSATKRGQIRLLAHDWHCGGCDKFGCISRSGVNALTPVVAGFFSVPRRRSQNVATCPYGMKPLKTTKSCGHPSSWSSMSM